MFFPIIALALASTCPPEGVSQMKGCYTDYFQSFNMTLFPDFATYSELLSRQLNNGRLTALESQCQSMNKLVSCLGNYADACVNGTVISNNFGTSSNDGYAYAGDYAEQAYYCGEGYDCEFFLGYSKSFIITFQ